VHKPKSIDRWTTCQCLCGLGARLAFSWLLCLSWYKNPGEGWAERERKGGRWNWSIACVYSDLVLDVKALQREWESVRSENERDLDCSINPDKQDDSGACCFTCLAHLHLDVWALYLLSPLINNSNSLALRSRSCTPQQFHSQRKSVSDREESALINVCVSLSLLLMNYPLSHCHLRILMSLINKVQRMDGCWDQTDLLVHQTNKSNRRRSGLVVWSFE